jgi:dolichyl-phosphate-mannose-protein mannosyltransferase
MRLLPASLGIALVPIAYLTLRSLGCRPATSLLASLLLTFENGLITQSRLVLLDSPLLFFTGLSTFFWVGFCAEDGRKAGSSCGGPFCRTWWAWLAMTGVSLGATLSCKWVGLFTIATVGLATIEQLWQILGDTRVPMKSILRHFVARAICLIAIPTFVYMFWFWIHFMVLSHSGDGDGFMSSEFQHTLNGHGMPDTYADVMLGSRVTLRHLHTQGGYLHSHPHMYPGGSKQQQITLYPHKDDNNDWIVLNETQVIGKESDPQKHGALTYVTDKMFIRLHHPPSGKKLHSHDIRPPVSEVDFQNEVSAYGFPDFDGDANDNFQVEIEADETDSRDRHAKKRLRALRTKFRLRHVLTGCYLFSHKVKLPEWGFDQQEVTCNKNPTKENSIWFIETNRHDLSMQF